MDIKRDMYLNQLISKKNNGLVKVITGIRRCGKSYLLFELYYNHLIQSGVKDEQIIKLALDDDINIKYRNPMHLSEYLRDAVKDKNIQYYVFIDEIQYAQTIENPYLEGNAITFCDVLNGLNKFSNVDIYVTGSNSKMLSSDILTEFRGRGDEVRVHPLSFSEFMSVYDGDKYSGWLEYYTFGGMPLVLKMQGQEQKAAYLTGLFKETYVKDIIDRNKIKNIQQLEEILDILSSSVGSLTNPNKLSKTFKSVSGVDLSPNTIKSYIEKFEDSFLINKTLRYDVKGKKYIDTPAKYYFEDVGLRNARLNFRQQEETHILENVIYNELRYRGFNVDVGIIEINDKQENGKYGRKQLEVDFVANKGSKRYYIQSAFGMPTLEKTSQEKRPLVNIDDSFKKIIVTKDRTMLSRDEYGIVTMDIFDFLLNENSLDL